MKFIIYFVFSANFAFPADLRAEFVEELKSAYGQAMPGVEFQVRESAARCEKLAKSNTHSAVVARMRCWEQHYRLRLRSNEAAMYLVPPVVDSDGTWWMTGAAKRRGNRCGGRVALGVVETVNHLGLPRWNHSLTLVAHELGHILGAGHVNTRSAMNANALPLVVLAPLPYDIQTMGLMTQFLLRCSR